MRGCEYLWDKNRANRVHQLVMESVGHPCGDAAENPCPFLPQKLTVVPCGVDITGDLHQQMVTR